MPGVRIGPDNPRKRYKREWFRRKRMKSKPCARGCGVMVYRVGEMCSKCYEKEPEGRALHRVKYSLRRAGLTLSSLSAEERAALLKVEKLREECLEDQRHNG